MTALKSWAIHHDSASHFQLKRPLYEVGLGSFFEKINLRSKEELEENIRKAKVNYEDMEK